MRFILILFSTFSLSVFGQVLVDQQGKVDSLIKRVRSEKDVIKKARVYLELSESYSYIDLDSVNFYAVQAEITAMRSNPGNKSKINEIKTIVASSYNNRGFAYFNMGDFPNALKYHKKALDEWKDIPDSEGIGNSLNNLGVVYRQLSEYEKAQKFFIEALQVYEKKGDDLTVALLYNNLGGIYKMLDQDEKAIEAYRKALKLRKKHNDSRGLATTLNNIGAFYKKTGVTDSAAIYFTQAYELIEQVGDQIGIAHASCNMGELALMKKEYSKAISYGEQALEIGQTLKANMIIVQASSLLEKIYESNGEWQKAYQMQRLRHETMLSIKSEEAKNAALQLEMQYAYEKQKEIDNIESEKQKEIAQNKSDVQKVTIYFITILLVLVAFFSFLIYREYRITLHQKSIIEKQSNERRIMLQEIHHRVKNNFQIISSLLRLQTFNKPNAEVRAAFDEAINRIHTMSTVHEIIYRQDALDEVDPQEYLENLVNNLSMSFEKSNVQIEIETCKEALKIDQTIPIGIIVNELITNSFKHAFDGSISHPRIRIELIKKNGSFELLYHDNGIGYVPKDHGNSFGLELIDTMVQQISGKIAHYADEKWATSFRITFV